MVPWIQAVHELLWREGRRGKQRQGPLKKTQRHFSVCFGLGSMAGVYTRGPWLTVSQTSGGIFISYNCQENRERPGRRWWTWAACPGTPRRTPQPGRRGGA